MDKLDWSQFTKRISIQAKPETLFKYWTIPNNIEKWFLSQADFYSEEVKKDSQATIKVGDKYIWMWHGSDSVAEGEVKFNNNLNKIEFTFLSCLVSVEIKEEAGETLIELIQSQIPLDEASKMSYYVGCSRGWTFYMTNLKSILEGGIDLRNKNMKLTKVINT